MAANPTIMKISCDPFPPPKPKRSWFCFFIPFIALAVLTGCSYNPPGDAVNSVDGWNLYADGSFSLKYGNMQLSDCYPVIDDRLVHPMHVEVRPSRNGGEIRYMLREGAIRLQLGSDSTGYFIQSRLEGFDPMPDWFLPLGDALVTGADRFYKQGFGFAGASGVYPLPEPVKRIESAGLKENVWSYDSYLFTGLIDSLDRTLVFSALDHGNYQHRSTLFNRQHRHGLIDRHLDTDCVYFGSGFALEGITVEGNTIGLPEIRIAAGAGAYITLQRMAKEIAEYNKVSLPHAPRYYYCSWYELYKEFDQHTLEGMLNGIKSMDTDPEIQAVQIDDGYAWYGGWLEPNERFPDGLGHAAGMIADAGYSPGIWVGPFMVSSNSFIYKEHKDWILKDNEGNMMLEWQKEDEDVYILDASHPEAFEYLRTVFRSLREMGFTTFKTDFMDWGLQDSRRVQRYNPGKTSVQYFTEVVEMIREEIGQESYWLGCISPFQQMIGHVDGIRVSNDVGENWQHETTINMFNEMYAGQFFNNVFWQNDPDVLYLRDYAMDLTEAERRTIALFDGTMGGTLTTSCRFHTLDKDALALWQFIKPGPEHVTAELPGWGIRPDVIPVVRQYPEKNAAALLLVNTSDQKIAGRYDIEKLTGITDPHLFEWGPGQVEKVESIRDKESEAGQNKKRALAPTGTLEIDLEPHASILLYISGDGEGPGDAGLNQ